MEQKQSIQQVKTYSALAKIYDQVMSHVDYELWAGYLKALFRLSERSVSVLADLSCGTGNILPFLHGRGRHILGFDLSPEMLQMARKKFADSSLTCSDFTCLPVKSQSVDVAISLYDSVNYLITDAQVLKFLNESYRIIRNGGLLIFDVVTPYLCKTAFKKYHESAEINQNLRYERFSFFKNSEQLQINRFHIWFNGQYFYEEHRQKIREIRDWVRLISQTNFKILEIFSNFSMKPVMETAERAHFVLKRKT